MAFSAFAGGTPTPPGSTFCSLQLPLFAVGWRKDWQAHTTWEIGGENMPLLGLGPRPLTTRSMEDQFLSPNPHCARLPRHRQARVA